MNDTVEDKACYVEDTVNDFLKLLLKKKIEIPIKLVVSENFYVLMTYHPAFDYYILTNKFKDFEIETKENLKEDIEIPMSVKLELL